MLYEKFGFCELKKDCNFYHPEEVCDDDLCDISSCRKRHPTPCKFHLHFGFCNFKAETFVLLLVKCCESVFVFICPHSYIEGVDEDF